MPSDPRVGCRQPLPEGSPRRVGLSPQRGVVGEAVGAGSGRAEVAAVPCGGLGGSARWGPRGRTPGWGLRAAPGTVPGTVPSRRGGRGQQEPGGASERSPGAPAGGAPGPGSAAAQAPVSPRCPVRPVLPRHCVDPDALSSLSSPPSSSPPSLIPPALPPPLPLIDVSAEMCPVPRISLISLREEGSYRRN